MIQFTSAYWWVGSEKVEQTRLLEYLDGRYEQKRRIETY